MSDGYQIGDNPPDQTAIGDTEISNALMIPTTGQLINLEDERELTIAFKEVKKIRDELSRVDRILKDAFAERKRILGTGTFYVEGVGKVEVKSGNTIEYDPAIVEDGLRNLDCPEEVIRQIVVEVVTYKVDGVRAKQAAAANPEYAAVIERSKTVKEKLPSVSIT